MLHHLWPFLSKKQQKNIKMNIKSKNYRFKVRSKRLSKSQRIITKNMKILKIYAKNVYKMRVIAKNRCKSRKPQ